MKLKTFFHRCFVYETWAVAWRTLPDADAPYPASGGEPPRYRVLPTDGAHWAADPFLLTRGGQTHLFFEYMPLHSRKAAIGCCALTPDGPGPIRTVLETACHLSYPAVFEFGGEVWLLPESSGDRNLVLYRAVEYPWVWEPASTLLCGFDTVDTTPVTENGRITLFLYDPDVPHNALRRLYTAELDMGARTLGPLTECAAYPARLGRPAGLPFVSGGQTVRPTQDCTARYGGSIRYLAYTGVGAAYAEHETGTLRPEDVLSDLPRRPLGLHTINRSGGFEVIDLYTERFSLWKPLRALYRRCCE